MRTFLRVVATIYIAYLVIALLLISPALNFLPHKYLQDTYGRELQTGWVILNPFTLSLDISQAQLGEPGGERFAGFSEASIDLSMESLWQPGWVLDTVRIRDLYVGITRHSADEYNFSDLLGDSEPPAAEPPASEDTALPGITIRELELHSEAIVITDAARETAYISRWNGLHIQVQDLSTVFEEGRPFSVAVEAADGGRLDWTGAISIPRGESSGQLSLQGLNLHKLWVYAEPWLAFELKDGRLLAEAEYRVGWNDGLSYSVNSGHLALADLDIAPKAPAQLADTAVSLKRLDIDGIALDSATHAVTINAVTLDTLAVAGWMEESRISLQDLFAVETGADAEETADTDTGGEPWTVALGSARLHNGSVRWRSAYTDPQVLDIKPLEASLENLNWPLSGDTPLSLSLAINEQAKIAVDGTLALDPGAGSIHYSLQGLPLTWFNPNLPEALKAKVTGGSVELEGQVALQEFAPTTITLEGKIREFSARREGAEVELTGFELVRIDGLAVDMTAHSLVLKQLTIDSYTGRIHIQEDGSINASKVWQAEVGEEAQQIAEDLTQDKPWTFSLPSIQISDSAIDFMDQSLPIQFRTVIGELDGEVLNLSSDPSTPATVDLRGSVDGYAPVTLSGAVTPMADPTNLDLTLVFDGVDMALLSPYSGTYAGYVIDRGLLDLNLHYSLKDNHLQGDNSIRVEKLKLGEKISSDKAVDLPLELALAILTDSNGVIDMQVPVTGDVNNPGFDLSGVISDAVVNLLTKAITAPFTLLANLVSSEEDLQRISFSSGSSTLGERSMGKLDELARALEQRPKLSLAITGRLNMAADYKRLQQNTLKQVLLERGLSEDDIKLKDIEWENEISALHADLPGAGTGAGELTPREQYELVVQSITVPDEQMLALASQRAVAVKAYLVNTAGLAPERAVVAQANLKESDNEFSGVELGID
ncbi:MAG: DUF748 domain-containing protein [Halioglobus sp.]|nr:DUF748 domain-containing protein [Halioglobus sp.]